MTMLFCLGHTNQNSPQPFRAILIQLTHELWPVQGGPMTPGGSTGPGELHACRGADIATISVEEPHHQHRTSSIAI